MRICIFRLNDPLEVRIGAGGEEDEVLPEELQSRAYYAAGDPQKLKILVHLLTTIKGKSIVFVKTKERLQRLEASLRRNGFKCASLQGSISMTERKAALRKFNEGESDILIATDVASRGLDLPDVTHVYNLIFLLMLQFMYTEQVVQQEPVLKVWLLH